MPRTVRFRSRIGIELRLVVLALALLLTPVFTVVIGAAAVPLDEVVGVLVSHIPGIDVQITWDRSTDAIVWDTRLPRIIAGVAVAAILGVAGVVLQAVVRNALAEPYVLGVSAGASSGAAFAIIIVGERRAYPVPAFIMLTTGWVALMFFCFVGYSWFYQRIVRRVHPDFIMVLGAGVPSGKVTPLLAGRIDRALGVWRGEVDAGRRPLLVMSGGQGPDEPVSEARAMAEYALEQGVPEAALVLEDRSTTTRENFQMSTDLVRAEPRLGPEATGIAVTSNYHAMRAALLARDLGTGIQVLGARTAWYYWPSAMLREFVAVVQRSPKAYVLGLALATVPLTLLVTLAAWLS